MTEHVSDISFDRAFVEELSDDEAQRVERHVAQCARCRERQSYLAEDRAAFLKAAPSFQAYRAARGPAKKRSLWWPLAAAACVLLASSQVLFPRALTRIKGSEQIGFYIKRGAQVTRGLPDQVVKPGDVLRFTYSCSEPKYFALMGRDAQSAVLFYPVAGQATKLPKAADEPFGFGIEVDAQPGAEHIYALFCTEPVALSPIVSTLDRTAKLEAPHSCVVRELQLRKVVP